MEQHDPIARLARQIDAAKKSEHLLEDGDAVVNLRRQGACDLHLICAEFAATLNHKLSAATLDVSPPAYTPEMFRQPGVNLIQISSQGREMQFAFQAPLQLVSTEKFLVPYILEGEVRTYNQRMLERFDIRSLLLFFCVADGTTGWRYFDWRTRHTGPLGQELLVSLMEPLF